MVAGPAVIVAKSLLPFFFSEHSRCCEFSVAIKMTANCDWNLRAFISLLFWQRNLQLGFFDGSLRIFWGYSWPLALQGENSFASQDKACNSPAYSCLNEFWERLSEWPSEANSLSGEKKTARASLFWGHMKDGFGPRFDLQRWRALIVGLPAPTSIPTSDVQRDARMPCF